MAFAGHRKAVEIANGLVGTSGEQSSGLRTAIDDSGTQSRYRPPVHIAGDDSRVPTVQYPSYGATGSPQTLESDVSRDETISCDEQGNAATKSLCVTNVPTGTTLQQVQDIFKRYGTITSLQSRVGQKCAVVTFYTLKSAIEARDSLHGKCIFDENQANTITYEAGNSSVGTSISHNMRGPLFKSSTDISPPPLKQSINLGDRSLSTSGHTSPTRSSPNDAELSTLSQQGQGKEPQVSKDEDQTTSTPNHPEPKTSGSANSQIASKSQGYSFLSSVLQTAAKSKALFPSFRSSSALQTKTSILTSTEQNDTADSRPKHSPRSRISDTPLSTTTISSRKSISIKNCRGCGNIGTSGKPLVGCISCPRRFHSFCGDPRPELSEPGEFECGHCSRKRRKAALRVDTAEERRLEKRSTLTRDNTEDLESPISCINSTSYSADSGAARKGATILDQADVPTKAAGRGVSISTASFHDAPINASLTTNDCGVGPSREAIDLPDRPFDISDEAFSVAFRMAEAEMAETPQRQSSEDSAKFQEAATSPEIETSAQSGKKQHEVLQNIKENTVSSQTRQTSVEIAPRKQIPPSGPRADVVSPSSKPWLKEDLRIFDSCRKIRERYKNHVACDRWPDRCSHGDRCDYAHHITDILLPQFGRDAKAWTCPWHERGKCHRSEEQCRFSHGDTGYYVRIDGLAASRKHLTCQFWYQKGRCIKSDEECYFAHLWTGLLPTLPLSDTRRQVRGSLESSSATQGPLPPPRGGHSLDEDSDRRRERTEASISPEQGSGEVISPATAPGSDLSTEQRPNKTNSLSVEQTLPAHITVDPRFRKTANVTTSSPTQDQDGAVIVQKEPAVSSRRDVLDDESASRKGRLSTNKCRECGKTVWKAELCGRCQHELKDALPVRDAAPQGDEVLVDDQSLADLPASILQEAVPDQDSPPDNAAGNHSRYPSKLIPLKRKAMSNALFAAKRPKPNLSMMNKSFEKPSRPAGPDLRAPDVSVNITPAFSNRPLSQFKEAHDHASSDTSLPVAASRHQSIVDIRNEAPESALDEVNTVETGGEFMRERSASATINENAQVNTEAQATSVEKNNVHAEENLEDDISALFEDDDASVESATICFTCNLRLPDSHSGVDVDWVQCMTCERWFHGQCVGQTVVASNDADEGFVCATCAKHVTNRPGFADETGCATSTMVEILLSESDDDIPLIRRSTNRIAPPTVSNSSDSDDEPLTKTVSLKRRTMTAESSGNHISTRLLPEGEELRSTISQPRSDDNKVVSQDHSKHSEQDSLSSPSTRPREQIIGSKNERGQTSISSCSCARLRNKCLHNQQGQLDGQKCYLWCAEGRARTSGRNQRELGEILSVAKQFETFCTRHSEIDPDSEQARLAWSLRTEEESPLAAIDTFDKTIQLPSTDTTRRISVIKGQSRNESPIMQPEQRAIQESLAVAPPNEAGDDAQQKTTKAIVWHGDDEQKFCDFYFGHLSRRDDVEANWRRGIRKLNVEPILIVRMAHSNMYDRHVPARPGNKSGFDHIGIRDVRTAIDELSEGKSIKERDSLAPGWMKDANDVLWKITQDRSAAYILEDCPQLPGIQPVTTDRIEQIEKPEKAQMKDNDVGFAARKTHLREEGIEGSARSPSAGKLRFDKKAGRLSLRRDHRSPTGRANTMGGQAVFQTMLPSPRPSVGRSESPFQPPNIAQSSIEEAEAEAGIANQVSEEAHANLIARMKSRGIQFEDSDDEEEEDMEAIPRLGQHPAKTASHSIESLSLPKITKGVGLKHPKRKELIQNRQLSRNLQLFGNAHEQVSRKHVKDVVGQALVDRKVAVNNSRDKFAPDKVQSNIEEITLGEFVGVPKDFEVEPCAITKGDDVQLAFRERRARGPDASGRPAGRTRRRKELWPVTDDLEDDT